MYTWVLATGLPILILSTAVRSFTADHTAVSVGPYILYILPLYFSFKTRNNRSGKASPPTIKSPTPRKHSSSSSILSKRESREGVNWSMSIPFFTISRANSPGIFCSISSAMINFKPEIRGSNISNTNISKQIVVTARIVFPGEKSIFPVIPFMKLTTLR